MIPLRCTASQEREKIDGPTLQELDRIAWVELGATVGFAIKLVAAVKRMRSKEFSLQYFCGHNDDLRTSLELV
jgi:flavodoxin